jgi:broad specificity phosphatase PhoE
MLGRMRRHGSAGGIATAMVLMIGSATLLPRVAAAAPGTIVLVRHAERAPAPMTDDPPLTDAGSARAARLAERLARADVKAIFVTRFRRSRDTAAPLAAALKLEPVVESETSALVAKLKARDEPTVLVVGHSDTLPDIVKAFGGPTVTIADDQFDDLFVLVPATGACLRLTY